MTLPFSSEQFFQVFADYNRAIWPVQVAAYAIALYALWVFLRGYNRASGIAYFVLAVLWLWNGIAYHFLSFARINGAAFLFGLLFAVQGLLFLFSACRGPRLEFRNRPDWRTVMGLAAIAYAMVVYSLLGWLAGHGWPAAPVFGVAPCPTTIFTIGLLLMASQRPPIRLIVIPIAWSLVGSSAAVVLGVREDLALLATAGALIAARLGSPDGDAEIGRR